MARLKAHIVMLPFMAQGHLIPFLGLARKLEERTGFTITLVSTPLNIQYLRTTISKDSSKISDKESQIQLESLSFNSVDHGLPPNTKNTEPPICIISDVFMGWANDVAKGFGTVNISFTTGGAYGTAAYVSLWQHLPHHISYLSTYPFLRNANGSDPWSQFFQLEIAKSLSSFDILRNYTNLPVWCVGPLLPTRMISRKPSSNSRIIGPHSGREPGLPTEKCLEWMDSYSECSVLYISFGSQNTISPSQMMALAMGLEESGKSFIWCIRPPTGFDLKSEFRTEWLPKGFEKIMNETNQGLVVHGWAPQLDIFCHRSTGAFFSHYGWNSVVENLS
ncbi:hypothetical protein M9H77_30371 [Catharanthus roseus]|uniref:Uncharacterized protein n=1 Tax=Catharanthus roseus TaxID=4058 RepID=A0ACB9ZXD3_CATRO|nr:hypothetical protein M9H77_30371 [Catharanthus roseus]